MARWHSVQRSFGVIDRLGSAVGRRTRRLWRLTDSTPPATADHVLDWLRRESSSGGVPVVSGGRAGSPAATALLMTTALSYGQRSWAASCCEWLRGVQQADGAFPDSLLAAPSLTDTAAAIRGLLTCEAELPESAETSDVRGSCQRACRYLVSRIDGQGKIHPVENAPGSFDHWAPLALRLTYLPPLLAAARHFQEPTWEAGVWRAVSHLRRTVNLTEWNMPSHLLAWLGESLLELGLEDESRRAMLRPLALRRRDGSLPAMPVARWVSGRGLAHLAVVWYRLGYREAADRAIGCLRRHAVVGGGFPGSWGPGACYYRDRRPISTATHYLDALTRQVAASFDGQIEDLPDTIAPTDGRLLQVRRWMADLPADSAVADVGCGKGRFLKHLAGCFPAARWTGIDLSAELLRHVPEPLDRRQGSMLRLPARDGEFAAAFAVESLEHCLLPEQAVNELCRVVRPGGQVLIIDKHRSRQALSKHAPWEQWFAPHEVSNWLRRHCDLVTSEAVPHRDHHHPTGLFICWTARRKPAGTIESPAAECYKAA